MKLGLLPLVLVVSGCAAGRLSATERRCVDDEKATAWTEFAACEQIGDREGPCATTAIEARRDERIERCFED